MKLNRKLLPLTLALPAICLAGGPDHYQHHDDSGMYVGVASGAAFTNSIDYSGNVMEVTGNPTGGSAALKAMKMRVTAPFFASLGYQLDRYLSFGLTYNHLNTGYKTGGSQASNINGTNPSIKVTARNDIDSIFADAHYNIPLVSVMDLSVGGGVGVVHMNTYKFIINVSDGMQQLNVPHSGYAFGFFGDTLLAFHNVFHNLTPFAGFRYMNYGRHTLTEQASPKFGRFSNQNLQAKPKAWLQSYTALGGVNYMFSM